MDYEKFTANLKAYGKLKNYQHNAELDLERLEYDLQGVKGVRYDTVHGTPNESEIALKRHTLSELIELKKKEIELYKLETKVMDEIISRLPTELWQMFYEKYILGMTYAQIGLKHGYSDHGIWKHMKRECEKYL